MLTFHNDSFGILKYDIGCGNLDDNGVDSFCRECVRDAAFQCDQWLQQQKLHVGHGLIRLTNTSASLEILNICVFSYKLMLMEKFD